MVIGVEPSVAPLSLKLHGLRASVITPDVGNGNSLAAFGGAPRSQQPGEF